MKYFDANGKMVTKRSSLNSKEREDRAKLFNPKNPNQFLLTDNSDFKLIFENYKKDKVRNVCFFSNDLIIYPNYQNSLLKQDGYYKKLRNKGGTNAPRHIKETLWPLKYKSTIVVPIIPMIDKDMIKTDNAKNGNKQDEAPLLAGTLCIDANEIDIFDEIIDVNLMQSFSETIFLYFNIDKKKWKIAQETKTTDQQSE